MRVVVIKSQGRPYWHDPTDWEAVARRLREVVNPEQCRVTIHSAHDGERIIEIVADCPEFAEEAKEAVLESGILPDLWYEIKYTYKSGPIMPGTSSVR